MIFTITCVLKSGKHYTVSLPAEPEPNSELKTLAKAMLLAAHEMGERAKSAKIIKKDYL